MVLLLATSLPCFATPTHYGSSGLLNLPTAQTLNEGNICVGLWTNCTTGKDQDGVIVPATITLGLGTFMEVYGSYPNLLFNDDEEASGRGFADLGFKFRIFGKRSDPFRLGLDLQARRSVSDNATRDGLTDYATTLIASYKQETYGFHANAGYIMNESPDDIGYDDQLTLGGGIEYYPANRLRTIAEISYETEKVSGLDGPMEATLGFQYFLTPHLTMNVGAGMGLTDASPDLRILFGFSTCQGVGTFNRPVPKLVDSAKVDQQVPTVPAKVIKVRPLTPLIPQAAAVVSPVSQIELTLPEPKEQVTVDPVDRMPSPDLSNLDASAVSPVGLPMPNAPDTLPAGAFQATVYRKFRFPELAFALDQYALTAEGEKYLSLVAEELRREGRDFVISVEGHTDSIGSETYNQNLSFQRAVSAATHLVLRNGLDPMRMFVKGHGESISIADNTTEDGRTKNRRVELLVLIPMPAAKGSNQLPGQSAK
ncbi:MAG: OmpA family protein [Desulfuromonadales bacterium]|nr:OmpA family protein [Desulfuromonadales bacterium]